jgi:hypothetical protein
MARKPQVKHKEAIHLASIKSTLNEVSVGSEMPSSVRILGRDWDILYYDKTQGYDEHGCTVESRRELLISDGQLPLDEADTVLHESIHAIDMTMDLELSEHQVRVLATALIGIFQDNPTFAEYITKQRVK